MKIVFAVLGTVLGLMSIVDAVQVKRADSDLAQLDAEQLSPINVIDNSRAGA